MMRWRGGLAALVLALAASAASAEGTVRAVLVGVSDYLHIDADLRGPRNDVVLMRAALIARGVAPDAITTLSEDGKTPTRTAILSALDDLARASGPGDLALFYFSGHGAQAPDLDGDEMGGSDELFLPADVRGWSQGAGTVENAISDDTFRARAQAILARGARLVAILDACHSATGFRALGGQGVARTMPPRLLGIPDTGAALADAAPPVSVAPLAGDFVFLYAAQSDERAFEYPQGPPDNPANWHGEFTRILSRTLRDVPDLTWDQAMQAVRGGMTQGGATQTPDAEGPMLGAPVFGTATVPPRRVQFRNTTLAAGALDGLQTGARLSLYADAVSDAVLAQAEIVTTDATAATFRVTDGTAPARGHARVTAPGLPPPVRFSAPQAGDPADGHDYAALGDDLARLAAGDRIDAVVFDTVPFDIGLVLTGGTLALTGPDGVLDPRGPGTSLRLVPGEDLTAALDRAARVQRLRAALGRGGRSGAAALLGAVSGLKVEAGHRAGRPDAGCTGPVGPETQPLRDGHAIAPCDQVWLHLRNLSRTARDVTVLYVDSTNRVAVLWPTGGVSNRLGFDESTDIGVQIVAGAGTGGREEMIVIAVPAQPGAPRADLSALADPAPSRAAQGAGNAAAGYLLMAADPAASGRGYDLMGPADPVEVTRFQFTFQPDDTEK